MNGRNATENVINNNGRTTQQPLSTLSTLNTTGKYNINSSSNITSTESPANSSFNPSNITLDCRNVQGEKRRRSCIIFSESDRDNPFYKFKSKIKQIYFVGITNNIISYLTNILLKIC